MESDLEMNKLRNDCSVDQSKIGAFKAIVREISTDPNENLLSKADQTCQLARVKLQLQRLRSKYESQHQLLENLKESGNMNEPLQRAAATGNEISVKRLIS